MSTIFRIAAIAMTVFALSACGTKDNKKSPQKPEVKELNQCEKNQVVITEKFPGKVYTSDASKEFSSRFSQFSLNRVSLVQYNTNAHKLSLNFAYEGQTFSAEDSRDFLTVGALTQKEPLNVNVIGSSFNMDVKISALALDPMYNTVIINIEAGDQNMSVLFTQTDAVARAYSGMTYDCADVDYVAPEGITTGQSPADFYGHPEGLSTGAQTNSSTITNVAPEGQTPAYYYGSSSKNSDATVTSVKPRHTW